MQAQQDAGSIVIDEKNVVTLPKEHEVATKEEKPERDLISKYNFYVQEKKERAVEASKLVLISGALITAVFILTLASAKNPDIYKMDGETASRINMAFNALIQLIVPFLLGLTGSVTRLLVSNYKLSRNISLLVSSGLVGAFSWICIKSGILMALVAPTLEKSDAATASPAALSQTGFYTLALAAIASGLVLTSVCLLINRKVEHLLREKLSAIEKA